jgi:hypothetical protein
VENGTYGGRGFWIGLAIDVAVVAALSGSGFGKGP